MGLFDDFGGTFKGLMNQVDTSALPELLGAALSKSKVGDLQTLVDTLGNNGFADRVSAWADRVGSSRITASEVLSGLGKDKVERIAGAVGLPAESVLTLLAEKLPEAVREASSHGDVMVHRSTSR